MEYMEYIIPAVGLIIVQLIVSYRQGKANDIKTSYMIESVKADIERLEKKQDKHNQLIERMIHIEDSDAAQWKRIDELKAKLP